MAISIAKQYYSDLSSLADPLRLLQGFDYFGHTDQMEFSVTTLDESITRNNYGSHNHDFQGLVEQAIEFVDSSHNSPEPWSAEYPKSVMHGTAPIDIQSKKRRMDWDSLDLQSNNNGGTEPKISHLTNGKERERKKTIHGARLGWTDDIDFDLNGELTNNAYLNNENFLSLSSSLNGLKQEVPSPTAADLKKGSKNSPAKELTANQSHDNNQHQLNNSIIKTTNNNIDVSSQALSPNETLEQHNETAIPHGNNIVVNKSSSTENGLKEKKTASDEYKFQYILAAATSIATKNNEETITYLNQGQSYEIKLKKLGDLTAFRGKVLKSIIKICFHERRLQYMEREQMHLWQASRPGERIVEIDVPLSYGLCHAAQPNNPNLLNVVEVLWDPMKEVGVYIKINCISTEFTPKKHGGEKGVPFRIQIETYIDNTITANGECAIKPIHAAACQIKVFKLKGADRKHKQDREKILKRPPSEKEKYQPSYECTILNDIPNESLVLPTCYSPERVRPAGSPLMSNSPIHMTKYDGMFSASNSNGANPIGINSVSSSNSNLKIMDQNTRSPQTPQQQVIENDEFNNSSGYSGLPTVAKETTPLQLAQWLNAYRLNQYVATFTHFTGADLLRMSKDDLIQICGLADGIRMYNTLHSKAITPRLTIYVSFDGSSYHAIYLHANTTKELIQKLFKLPGFTEHLSGTNGENNLFSTWNLQSKYSGSGSNLYDSSKLNVYINGPAGIHVFATDEVLSNIKDDSLFTLEIQNNKVLMKAVYKNEIN